MKRKGCAPAGKIPNELSKKEREEAEEVREGKSKSCQGRQGVAAERQRAPEVPFRGEGDEQFQQGVIASRHLQDKKKAPL